MRRLIWLLFVGIFFLAEACNSPLLDLNLKRKVILEVTHAEQVSPDSLLLTGAVYDLDQNASDVGFVWIDDINAFPTRALNAGSSSPGGKDRNSASDIEMRSGKFKLNRTYVISAYAVVEGKEYYSDSIHFTIPNGRVITLDYTYTGGRSITLTGKLEGTSAGLVARQHGFVWSTSNPEPTLTDNSVDMGVLLNDEPFSYKLEDIPDGTNLYIRAFGSLLYEGQESIEYGAVRTFDGNLFDFWEEIANVPPLLEGMGAGVAFSINGIGYIGLGETENGYSTALFSYDPSTKSWALADAFPGPGRSDAACFVLDGKAYVGFGKTGISTNLNDLYVFDPDTGWEAIPQTGNWPAPRSAAFSFAINGKGYVGGGEESFLDNFGDLWQFDPITNSWTQKSGCPGPERAKATSFTIDGRGYTGLGERGNGEPLRDFWSYDPLSDNWSQIADFEGGLRDGAAGFVLKGQGYVFSGSTWTEFDGIYPKDIWAYSPTSDSWEKKEVTGPSGRGFASTFSIGSKGFMGTGIRFDAQGSAHYLKDFWIYHAE